MNSSSNFEHTPPMHETLLNFLRIFWDICLRRKGLILFCILVFLTIAGIMAMRLQNIYRSSTMIIVENQSVPKNYVSSVVSSTATERLAIIRQQIFSRTVLSQVIKKLQLFNVPEGQINDGHIAMLRKRITVSIESRRNKQVQAFSIAYKDPNPVTAQQVTEHLATQFIEENLKIREKFVSDATEFLDLELAEAKEALEKKEKEISNFKLKYMGELPGQLEANLRTLDRIQAQLSQAQDLIPRLNDQLSILESQIHEYRTVLKNMEKSPQLAKFIDPRITLLEQKKGELRTLSAQYKESYPDIVSLKKEIAILEGQVAGIQEDQSGNGEQQAASSTGGVAMDSHLNSLITQRDKLKLEIADQKMRKEKLSRQLIEYEKKVERIPAHEQELIILQRDYANMESNYQSLLGKRINAKIAKNLEERQKGEKFRVIDPAHLPTSTEPPYPWQVMLGGLIFGTLVGCGSAYLLEYSNSAFRWPEEIEGLLNFPILASVPSFDNVYTKTERRQLISTWIPDSSEHHGKLGDAEVGSGLGRNKPYPLSPKKSVGSEWWRVWKNGNGDNHRGPENLPLRFNLVSMWRPSSVVAEQYRVAATRLSLMEAQQKNNVVGITSSLQGEGKTTTAVNVAYTFARDLGKETLLIDCDFNRPMAHRYLGMPGQPGMASLLKESVTSLDDYIIRVGELPLWFLPCGSVEGEEPSLLLTHRLGRFLSHVREKFEYVILDTPPILPLADMNVLANLVDTLVLVVRSGATPRNVVQRALKMIEKGSAEVPILLNGVPNEDVPYYIQQAYYSSSGPRQDVQLLP